MNSVFPTFLHYTFCIHIAICGNPLDLFSAVNFTIYFPSIEHIISGTFRKGQTGVFFHALLLWTKVKFCFFVIVWELGTKELNQTHKSISSTLHLCPVGYLTHKFLNFTLIFMPPSNARIHVGPREYKLLCNRNALWSALYEILSVIMGSQLGEVWPLNCDCL